jgi:hypothetical protein
VPFQTWADCSDLVHPIVQTQIVRLCLFVMGRSVNDRVLKVEDPFAGSQHELRAHFQLPQLH